MLLLLPPPQPRDHASSGPLQNDAQTTGVGPEMYTQAPPLKTPAPRVQVCVGTNIRVVGRRFRQWPRRRSVGGRHHRLLRLRKAAGRRELLKQGRQQRRQLRGRQGRANEKPQFPFLTLLAMCPLSASFFPLLQRAHNETRVSEESKRRPKEAARKDDLLRRIHDEVLALQRISTRRTSARG